MHGLTSCTFVFNFLFFFSLPFLSVLPLSNFPETVIGELNVFDYICIFTLAFTLIWLFEKTECVGRESVSSVTQSCPTLCNPMDCSTPGLLVHHQPPESTQTHVHWVRDAIQPSHPLSSPSPPTFNLSQHQGLFKWVSSSHQVAKILEFHQSVQWTLKTDLL